MPIHNSIDYPVDKIRRWIEIEGKTQQWIADHLAKTLDSRCSAKLLYKVCKKHGIKCQRTGPRAAEGHPEWKGGRIVGKHGYVKIYCPDHPTCVLVNESRKARANGGYYPKAKYAWEHRLVMEKHLGRFLLPGEVVHHLNGVKDDNRLENLMLFQSNGEHLKIDLAGRCPNWTPGGKERLRIASAKAVSTSHTKAKHGVPRHQRIPDHLIAERDALAQQVLQTGVLLQQLPSYVRPKRKRDADPKLNQSAG